MLSSRLVALADGAEENWRYFDGDAYEDAIKIVDHGHASQHLRTGLAARADSSCDTRVAKCDSFAPTFPDPAHLDLALAMHSTPVSRRPLAHGTQTLTHISSSKTHRNGSLPRHQ